MIDTNRFKSALQKGNRQYGIWNGIPHSYAAELCAGAGFDFAVIDAEHAPFDLNQIIIQLQAMSRYPSCSPIVRIPTDDPVLIKRLLDAGVQNFIVPMLESADQVRQMSRALRYPPEGIRGVGTALARAAQWNRVDNYFQDANKEVCLIAQIESVLGIEALDDILNEGVAEVIFLGPADLAGSMGYLGQPGHPDVVESVTRAIQKITDAGQVAGILTSSAELISKYEDMGVLMLGVGLDTILLSNATSALARKYKPELKDKKSNTKY